MFTASSLDRETALARWLFALVLIAKALFVVGLILVRGG